MFYKDWETIRKDLGRLPVEGVDGDASVAEILYVLQKYGITDRSLELWGTGTPLREFLWSEEMADACVYLMEQTDFKDICRDVDGKEVREYPCQYRNRGRGDNSPVGTIAAGGNRISRRIEI